MEKISEYDHVDSLFTQLKEQGFLFEPIDSFFCGFMAGRHGISVVSILERTALFLNQMKANNEKASKCSVYEQVSKTNDLECFYLKSKGNDIKKNSASGKKTLKSGQSNDSLKPLNVPSTSQRDQVIGTPNTRSKARGTASGSLSSSSSSSSNSTRRVTKTCAICFDGIKSRGHVGIPLCEHQYHKECIILHLENEIKTRQLRLNCPECQVPMKEEWLQQILSPELQERLRKTVRDLYIEKNPEQAFYCPKPDCGHSNIVLVKTDTVKCEKCEGVFCFRCKKISHYGSICETSTVQDNNINEAELKKLNITPCPVCKRLVQRDEGCTQMKCICQTLFCFTCGKVSGIGSYCKCALFTSNPQNSLAFLSLSSHSFGQGNFSFFTRTQEITQQNIHQNYSHNSDKMETIMVEEDLATDKNPFRSNSEYHNNIFNSAHPNYISPFGQSNFSQSSSQGRFFVYSSDYL
jgi:hypothetical protein